MYLRFLLATPVYANAHLVFISYLNMYFGITIHTSNLQHQIETFVQKEYVICHIKRFNEA